MKYFIGLKWISIIFHEVNTLYSIKHGVLCMMQSKCLHSRLNENGALLCDFTCYEKNVMRLMLCIVQVSIYIL